jgi:uncharacterized protein (DUF885 family)
MYENIIERWKKANPISCQGLGFHEYDGEVPNRNPEYVEKRIMELNQDISTLKSFKKPDDKINEFELFLVLSALEKELFELRDRQGHLNSAASYVSGWYNAFNMIQKSHTQRSYATIDERVKLITLLESKLPQYLDQAKENLNRATLSVAATRASLNYVSGYISYYQDELIEFVSLANNDNIIHEWSEVNNFVIDALKEFKIYLEKKLESASTDFSLGEEKFLALLKYTEGVEISVDQLLEVGYEDLEKNYQSMLEIASKRGQDVSDLINEIQLDYPNPETMLEYTSMTSDRARQFVLDSNLVSVPSDEQCQVIYTPKSDRKFEFASMNTPGPFEVPEASEAYYRVNPPDPSWSENRIHEYMKFFNKAFFESVTVHEAWPGHYLQLLYTQQSKSEIAKMFAHSITMIEGWAHYCEEMIYENGYSPFDRDIYHAGQLLGALMRNVRYISAVQMHCRGMTVEESKKMFMEKAFMPEPNAEIEANRGTIDPMYLNYTLGKLLIKKLRSDYANEKGESFSLKEFHDRLLSYGSAPITILRNILLKNSNLDIL